MLDLVSTRNGVDPETAACAQLLTAVITTAISDASKPISKAEAEIDGVYAGAFVALHWIFHEQGGTFDRYAALIGSDADSIRAALLKKKDPGEFIGGRSFSNSALIKRHKKLSGLRDLKLWSSSAVEWLEHGERAACSEDMFEVLTGICVPKSERKERNSSEEVDFSSFQKCGKKSYPSNASDIRSCRLLLEKMPYTPNSPSAAGSLSIQWSALFKSWGEICEQMDSEVPTWRNQVNISAPKTEALISKIIKSSPKKVAKAAVN